MQKLWGMNAVWGNGRGSVWHGEEKDAWSGLCGEARQRRFCLVVERTRLRYRAIPTGSFHISACNASQSNSRRRSSSRSSLGLTKSDMEFLKTLEEYMLSTGLPLDKVPSTQELSCKGRKDLANAVKRRGYKAVMQLLIDRKVLNEKEVGKSNNETVHGGTLSAASNDSKLQLPGSQVEPEDAGLSCCKNDQPLIENFSSRTLEERFGASSSGEALSMADIEKFPHVINGPAVQSTSISSADSLHEEAIEFIRSGRFPETADSSQYEEENRSDSTKKRASNDHLLINVSSNTDDHFSSHFGTRESIATRNVTQPRSKSSLFLGSREHRGESLHIHEGILCRDSSRVQESGQVLQSLSKVDNDSRLDFQRQVRLELDTIKMALISREMELATMSRELEEAKAQLALFHAKATAELTQTKQFVLEKDHSLQAAQATLAHLKQVPVEWWGEGDKVELAGSFNGWQYTFTLDPDPSSEIAHFDGSRGPMMWGTTLWLYPGFYEIKFIVDGDWTIDQRREVVMGNVGQNNVLRVDT